MKARSHSVLHGKGGTTLVELVVCFALICVFFGGVSMVLASSLRVYRQVQSLDSAMTTAELVLDQISAEVSDAALLSSDDRLTVRPDRLELTCRSGTPLCITTDGDGYLLFRYPSVDWGFDKGAYLGFRIQHLSFHSALSGEADMADYANNVIRVDLTLTDGEGSFQYHRYIRCRSFLPQTHRIIYEPSA